jgi:hypothetical protein
MDGRAYTQHGVLIALHVSLKKELRLKIMTKICLIHFLKQLHYLRVYVYCHMLVTRHGVCIDYSIYWTLVIRDYTAQIPIAHTSLLSLL